MPTERPIRLSVIIPNYNHAPFLKRCLDSVLSQSRLPEELLVLDDGSTDNSLEILEVYAQRHPNIRILRNDSNQGLNRGLVRLLAEASGDYIYGLGADDFVLPQFFESAMAAGSLHPSAGIIFGRVRYVDESGQPLDHSGGDQWRTWDESRFLSTSEFLNDYLARHCVTHSLSSTTIYRTEALREAGGFKPELGAWTDTFALRAVGLKYGAFFLNHDCNCFTIGSDAFSAKSMADPWNMLDIVNRAARLMRSPEFCDFFPEAHVKWWETGYRRIVIDNALVACEDMYNQAGSKYFHIATKKGGMRKCMAVSLMKAAGFFRRMQFWWLKRCLRNYASDSNETKSLTVERKS